MSTYKYRQWQFPLMLRIAPCQDTLAKGSLRRDQLIERKQTGLNSDLSQNLKSKYNSKGSKESSWSMSGLGFSDYLVCLQERFCRAIA